MPRPLNRIDDAGIINYERRSDLITRALAKGRSEYYTTYGRYPQTFLVTQVAYDDLVSKFPGSQRGTRRVFFGMTMRVNDSIGLTDDEFEYAD